MSVDAVRFGEALAAGMDAEGRQREGQARCLAEATRSLPSPGSHGTSDVAAETAGAVLTRCVGSHPFGDNDHRRQWIARYQRALRQSGQAALARSGFAAALVEAYDEPASWEVYPDVPGALRGAKARGLRLVVASNFSTSLDRILNGLGIADVFTFIGASAGIGWEKPDVRFYLQLSARAGVRPEQTWFIGDDLVNDVVVPRLLGMGGLWVRRGHAPGAEAGPTPAGWTEFQAGEGRVAHDLAEAFTIAF